MNHDELSDRLQSLLSEYSKCIEERDAALREVDEQARLLGMGSEREARLMAERDALQQRVDLMSEYDANRARVERLVGDAIGREAGQ